MMSSRIMRLFIECLYLKKAKNLLRQFSNTGGVVGSAPEEMDSETSRFDVCAAFEMPQFPIELQQHKELLEDKIYRKYVCVV